VGTIASATPHTNSLGQKAMRRGETAIYQEWVARARKVLIESELERRGVKLRGNGHDRCGPCPKCGGDDRFSINTAKQVFNCRGCGTGGDVIKLVEHLDGLDFNAACMVLTGKPPTKVRGPDPRGEVKKVVRAEFSYHDQDGALQFVIDRVEFENQDGSSIVTKEGKRKKTFRQRRPDPNQPDNWLWNVDGVPPLPYRLPETVGGHRSRVCDPCRRG
jgi:CHC2 zinc finger